MKNTKKAWAIVWNYTAIPYGIKAGTVISLHTEEPIVSTVLYKVVPITYEIEE